MKNEEQRQCVAPDINILRQAIYEAIPYWRAKVDEITDGCDRGLSHNNKRER